jgi:hypothetical protein
MTAVRWTAMWLVLTLVIASMPETGTAQLVSPGAVPSPPSPAPAPASTAPPASDEFYAGAAVAATALSFPAHVVVCGLGNIAGFFTLAVIRLPVWVATLGDHYGSSEPLSRIGNSIIERACGEPWSVTGEQMKDLARGGEGKATPAPPSVWSD